jgi:hypothetical protein
MIFLIINNHTVLFIMKLLVSIKVPINRSKDILIIIHIWIKGTQGKNIVSLRKWAIITCIYPLYILNQHEDFIHFLKPNVQNFVKAKLLKHPCLQSFHLLYHTKYGCSQTTFRVMYIGIPEMTNDMLCY